MESRTKLFGHPVHPMLVVFPLGLLGTAVVFDIIRLATGNGYWSEIAFWMIAAGIAAGLMAALGFFLALATGWLGGELVDRLGVGVDDDANINAPSSLTHRRVIRG